LGHVAAGFFDAGDISSLLWPADRGRGAQVPARAAGYVVEEDRLGGFGQRFIVLEKILLRGFAIIGLALRTAAAFFQGEVFQVFNQFLGVIAADAATTGTLPATLS